ncbi:hypothetical protein, partial [Escherichia coli]|uniref:hypothetical protein n=1 Tax=Escherichia coli TaxID=562 RepID=UPI001BC8C5A6
MNKPRGSIVARARKEKKSCKIMLLLLFSPGDWGYRFPCIFAVRFSTKFDRLDLWRFYPLC